MSKDFSRKKLQGASLQGQNLTDTNFSYADIRGANFTNAILTGANFSHAKTGLLTSGTVVLIVIAWVLALSTSLIFSSIAGVCAGIILAWGELAIAFCAVVMLAALTFFVIISTRYGLEQAVKSLIATLPLTFVTALVMAVVGGLSGLVPYSGAEGVAVLLSGAITGDFIAIMTAAAALSVAVAGTIAGTANAAGTLLIVMTALGTMVTAVASSLIMSMAQTEGKLLSSNGLIAVNKVMEELQAKSISPSEASAQLFTLAGKNAGAAMIAGIITIAIPAAAFGSYIAWRTLAGDERYASIRRFTVRWTSAFGTRFQGADLTDADFTGANLNSADLTGANLTRTCWYRSENLSRARLERTYLDEPQIRRLVVTKQGQNQIFNNQNLQTLYLRGANLENAQFIGTDLSRTDLQEANLSRAILVRSQLDRTKLNGANLTGACIENWGVTKTTEIKGIEAQYVYLEWVNEEKRNQMPQNNEFKKGEFQDFVRSETSSFTISHKLEDVNPNIVLKTLQELSAEHQEEIEIVAVKNQDGKINLDLQTSEFVQEDIKERYQEKYNETFNLFSMLDREGDSSDEFAIFEQRLRNIIDEVKQPRSVHIKSFYNNSIFITGGYFNNNIETRPVLELLKKLQTIIESDKSLSNDRKKTLKISIHSLIKSTNEAKIVTLDMLKKQVIEDLRILLGSFNELPASSELLALGSQVIQELKSFFNLHK